MNARNGNREGEQQDGASRRVTSIQIAAHGAEHDDGYPIVSRQSMSTYRNAGATAPSAGRAIDDDCPVCRDVTPRGNGLDRDKRGERKENGGRAHAGDDEFGGDASPPLGSATPERPPTRAAARENIVVVSRKGSAACGTGNNAITPARPPRAALATPARSRHTRQRSASSRTRRA